MRGLDDVSAGAARRGDEAGRTVAVLAQRREQAVTTFEQFAIGAVVRFDAAVVLFELAVNDADLRR